MLALQRMSDWMMIKTELDILPLPPPTTIPKSRSRFESLPAELRLQIYSLLLNGKPECCHFERCNLGRTYSIPRLYPAILAVNRSISAEAYPILYGENTFLFLGKTRIADHQDVCQQFLSRRAGLPNLQKPSLLPEQSRHLIKHVAVAPLLEIARNDWAGQLLDLAPATKTIEFDFWVTSYRNPRVLAFSSSVSTLNASISAIKSLITASTQTFRIATRDIDNYNDSGWRFARRKPVKLPGVQLAVVNLKGSDNMQEKSRTVHKALNFIIEIIGQRPLMPNKSKPPSQALVSVEKGLLIHSDFAGFWCSHELTVPAEKRGWIPLDSNGQNVNIGLECKSIIWQRWPAGHVKNKVLDGYGGW